MTRPRASLGTSFAPRTTMTFNGSTSGIHCSPPHHHHHYHVSNSVCGSKANPDGCATFSSSLAHAAVIEAGASTRSGHSERYLRAIDMPCVPTRCEQLGRTVVLPHAATVHLQRLAKPHFVGDHDPPVVLQTKDNAFTLPWHTSRKRTHTRSTHMLAS